MAAGAAALGSEKRDRRGGDLLVGERGGSGMERWFAGRLQIRREKEVRGACRALAARLDHLACVGAV